MKTALVLCLVSSLVFAAPADAPVELKAGQVAPVSGTLVPDATRIQEGKDHAACADGLAKAKQSGTLVSTPVLIGGVVAAVAIVAAAVGVGYAAGQKSRR